MLLVNNYLYGHLRLIKWLENTDFDIINNNAKKKVYLLIKRTQGKIIRMFSLFK